MQDTISWVGSKPTARLQTGTSTHNVWMSANTPDSELMDLLDRIAVQEEAALKQLYEHSAARLYGLALRILGNKEWAEDVLQESFLGIWRNAGS